MLGSRWNNF